jgi:hypothetical protein
MDPVVSCVLERRLSAALGDADGKFDIQREVDGLELLTGEFRGRRRHTGRFPGLRPAMLSETGPHPD